MTDRQSSQVERQSVFLATQRVAFCMARIGEETGEESHIVASLLKRGALCCYRVATISCLWR